jgi:hypothetical protein
MSLPLVSPLRAGLSQLLSAQILWPFGATQSADVVLLLHG